MLFRLYVPGFRDPENNILKSMYRTGKGKDCGAFKMILVHRQLTGNGSLIYEIGEGCIVVDALEFEEKMRRIAMEDCPDRIFIEASGFETVRCRESMYAAKREGPS